jgi:prepilin-type N-terminal cleavage/methylation domain-containing protein
MRMRLPIASDERGYTLVELLVAVMVLVIGMLGAFTLVDGANKTTVTNNARTGATNLAREILEDARSVDYDSLTPTAILPTLRAKQGDTATTLPWIVSRRGIEYTVTTDVCTFDDPKDNVAASPPANVCLPQAPVPATAGTLAAENQPDDFRRVTVTLTWNTGGGAKTLALVSLINNPAGGLGPRITLFTAPPDNAAQVTAGTSATFPTTTTSAGSVHWNSDGTPNGAGDSTGGPTGWTTTWSLGSPALAINPPLTGSWPPQYSPATVLDGSYTVTAQAFDTLGIAGDARVAVLPLNRSLPTTVVGFEAGRNSYQGSVDFQWNPSPERDITGYRVYNAGPDNTLGNGNDTLVCSAATVNTTSCSDPSPPVGMPSYFVVARDRTNLVDNSSTPRESPYATVATVLLVPVPAPLVPLTLAGTPDPSTGNPALTWTHASPAGVRFFRIYRDSCCSVADRYGATAGNALSWTDPKPGTANRKYWVTAVGPTLNESAPSDRFDWVRP